MTLPVKPSWGFLRLSCGLFIRDYLWGTGPHGSPSIDHLRGACQADVFYYYKQALRQTTAEDRATRQEEKNAKKAPLR